jgi:hypothetical protein
MTEDEFEVEKELGLEPEPEDGMWGYEFGDSTDPEDERDAYKQYAVTMEKYYLLQTWSWKVWAMIATVLWVISTLMWVAEKLK